MLLKEEQKAYIAGFLDGDGSIYVRLKPHKEHKYHYQIVPVISFSQSEKSREYLLELKDIIGKGYLRKRNDGMLEYVIGDLASLKEVTAELLPYLKLKKVRAMLLLEILEQKENIENSKDFLKLAQKIDKLASLNYSKKRIHDSLEVAKTLKKAGLLTP